MRIALTAILGGLLLASCGGQPANSIEKDCVRLGFFSQIAGDADAKKSCACLSEKLEDSMSEKDLKLLAKTFKESKTEQDFEANAQKNGLSDMAGVNMLGAAKSCALQ